MDFGESLHDEAGVIMINEIANPIDGIEPGAVGILIIQDEIQVSFSSLPVIVIGKDLRSARQQKSPVSGGVDDTAATVRSIGTTAGGFRCPEILDIVGSVSRDRRQDVLPLIQKIQRTEGRGRRTEGKRDAEQVQGAVLLSSKFNVRSRKRVDFGRDIC